MKVLIVATLMAFTFGTASAQMCSNCNQKSISSKEEFTPTIFTPGAIGTATRGIGYITNVQTNSTRSLLLTIYMVGADGKLFSFQKQGQIVNRPGYWPDEFMVPGSFDPTTMKYHTPKPIGFIFTPYYQGTGPDGKPILVEDVTISF